jgi:phosphocarrier protein
MSQEKPLPQSQVDDPATGSVFLTHTVGLHARPSVTLTKLAKKFTCRIELGCSDQGPWVDAKSIAKVMKMKVPENTVVHFRASGADAADAVHALMTLVKNDFKSD